MRTYHEIMHEYSSSKTSSGQNVRFVVAPRKREAQFRSVYHVEAGVDPHIPLTTLGWDESDRPS